MTDKFKTGRYLLNPRDINSFEVFRFVGQELQSTGIELNARFRRVSEDDPNNTYAAWVLEGSPAYTGLAHLQPLMGRDYRFDHRHGDRYGLVQAVDDLWRQDEKRKLHPEEFLEQEQLFNSLIQKEQTND